MKTTTEIVFVESTHQYFVKGREVRSLSSLTRPLHEPLPDHPVVQRNLANARARGAQVDDGAARIMLGKGFPIATVSDEAIPYLHAFASFWQETKPTMEGPQSVGRSPVTPCINLTSVFASARRPASSMASINAARNSRWIGRISNDQDSVPIISISATSEWTWPSSVRTGWPRRPPCRPSPGARRRRTSADR